MYNTLYFPVAVFESRKPRCPSPSFNTTNLQRIFCYRNPQNCSSYFPASLCSLLIGVLSKADFCLIGKKKEEKKYYFFHSGGHKTNFKALFLMLTLGHICSFAFVLLSIDLIQGWRVKGMFSIKVLVLGPPELEFCGLLKLKKKNPKT